MSICGKLSDPISFNVAIIVAIDLIQQNTFPSGKVTRRRLCLVLCRSASFSSIAKYFIYWCLLKKSFNDICPSLRTICTNHIRLCASCTLSDPASNLSTICQQAISRKFTRVSRFLVGVSEFLENKLFACYLPFSFRVNCIIRSIVTFIRAIRAIRCSVHSLP